MNERVYDLKSLLYLVKLLIYGNIGVLKRHAYTLGFPKLGKISFIPDRLTSLLPVRLCSEVLGQRGNGECHILI